MGGMKRWQAGARARALQDLFIYLVIKCEEL